RLLFAGPAAYWPARWLVVWTLVSAAGVAEALATRAAGAVCACERELSAIWVIPAAAPVVPAARITTPAIAFVASAAPAVFPAVPAASPAAPPPPWPDPAPAERASTAAAAVAGSAGENARR